MSSYLKALGLHVYIATTKKSYFGKDKYIEANAQALVALRQLLSKDCLYMISHCDSALAAWNTSISLKEQAQHILNREPRRNKSDQTCFMVQGNDSFEVNSDTLLDDCASTSNDEHDLSLIHI